MKKVMSFLIIFALFSTSLVFASEHAGYIMEILGGPEGSLQRLADERAAAGEPMKKQDKVSFGDILLAKGVMVKIVLDCYKDAPLVVVKPETKIRLEKNEKCAKGGIFNFFGRLLFKAEGTDHKGFKIMTSNAIAGVEGTEFECFFDLAKSETVIKVIQGIVDLILAKIFPGSSKENNHQLLHAGDIGTVTNRGFGSVLKKSARTLGAADVDKMRSEWGIEVPEVEVADNYETDGDVTVLLSMMYRKSEDDEPMNVPKDARIIFEGCRKLNGAELKYNGGTVRLDKLVHGVSYNLRFEYTGYGFDFGFEADREKPEIVLNCIISQVRIVCPAILKNITNLSKAATATLNGRQYKISYIGINPSQEGTIFFETEGDRVVFNFVFPEEGMEEPLKFEFEYTGELNVKNRKLNLILDGSKTIYEFTLE